MARRDSLTGLLNKGAFEAVLRCSREGGVFSLFIFDIDYFKHYNDTNGHQAGDEVLYVAKNKGRNRVVPAKSLDFSEERAIGKTAS